LLNVGLATAPDSAGEVTGICVSYKAPFLGRRGSWKGIKTKFKKPSAIYVDRVMAGFLQMANKAVVSRKKQKRRKAHE